MTNISSYQINQRGVDISFADGTYLPIVFNNDTGEVFWRYKVDTITSVKHPCIYLGFCLITQTHYVIHNHYKLFGTAGISSWEEFTANQEVYQDNQPCNNTPLERIDKALNHVVKGEEYSFANYNCQTLVNDVCNNTRRSEDVNKWLGIGALGVLLFVGITVFSE